MEPPPRETAAAYAFLKENESNIAKEILRAIFETYPRLRQTYGYDEAAAKKIMPELKRPEDLRSLIGLHGVHFLKESKDGVGCVGFEFGCTWDEEHGLGVLTHKLQVIEVGSADTAFLGWNAVNWIAGRNPRVE